MGQRRPAGCCPAPRCRRRFLPTVSPAPVSGLGMMTMRFMGVGFLVVAWILWPRGVLADGGCAWQCTSAPGGRDTGDGDDGLLTGSDVRAWIGSGARAFGASVSRPCAAKPSSIEIENQRSMRRVKASVLSGISLCGILRVPLQRGAARSLPSLAVRQTFSVLGIPKFRSSLRAMNDLEHVLGVGRLACPFGMHLCQRHGRISHRSCPRARAASWHGS